MAGARVRRARGAAVVDGVTKLDRLEFDSKEAQQAATIRKMFIAMAQDWRVLLIKLADRLHNMRTISVMPEVRQRATAQETLDVYAPLAHRLGVQQVKWQLEDLASRRCSPSATPRSSRWSPRGRPSARHYLGEVMATLRDKLDAFGINAEVTGRPKHLWSIYEKMVVSGKEFDEIFDLVGLRVDRRRGARLLGGARRAARAVAPGPGPVQGLHQPAQVQPVPVAAHDGDRPAAASPSRSRSAPRRCTAAPSSASPRTGATRRTRRPRRSPGCGGSPTSRRRTSDPIDFLEALKLDLEQDEVYVFTPKGRVIALVANATPVDFAYAVHTEVGHHCVGRQGQRAARPPRHASCSSADVVEIVTSKAETRRPVAGLAQLRPVVAGARPRSASGSSASGARTPSRAAARS